METTGRPAATDLSSFADLFEALADFDRDSHAPRVRRGYAGDLGFFEAVRMLDCEFARRSDEMPPRTGAERTTPSKEPFRMSQRPTVRFSANSIAGFDSRGWRGKPELIVTFFGLLGVDGPLPLFLTELVIERVGKDDFLLQRFLDVFHHRLLELYYRAWSEARVGVQSDRAGDDRFSRRVDMLIGLETGASRTGSADFKRFFAGRYSNRVRNPDGLRAILRDVFEELVEVEECVGRLVPNPDVEGHRLGREGGVLGAMTIGTRLRDCLEVVGVELGPLTFAAYSAFLPGTAEVAALRETIREYTGPEFGVELRLILHRDEVPLLHLDGSARLGWTSWVRTGPLAEHPVTRFHLDPEPW
jgi:type VI secretion system protein ImpH